MQPNRISGRILDWKGKFGWIQPDGPVAHPSAGMRGGRLYLTINDCDGGIPPNIGDHVSFFVYIDTTGLGAMNCQPVGRGAGVQNTIGKPQPLGPMGARPPQTAPPQQQRQSLGEERYSGSLSAWNGSCGWILPAQNISHERYNGKVFLNKTDVDNPSLLTEGVAVTFSLYTDSQKLGAQHCSVGDGQGAAGGASDAGVLRPKPKGAAGAPLQAKPKVAAGSGSAAGKLQAKPKSGPGKPNMCKMPAHLSKEVVDRLAAWMWDKGC